MGFQPRILMMIIAFQMLVSLGTSRNATFDQNYHITWGKDRILIFKHGQEVQLSLDQSSDGTSLKRLQKQLDSIDESNLTSLSSLLSVCFPPRWSGFGSKEYFGSGFFQMRIKLPDKDSAGVVTAFYLNSNVGVHDELDFEFLGNRPGKPIVLQTNVFANGLGSREQRTRLWFDPTADFHYYKLLWNQHQIVFFIDDIPIRVYKNDIITGLIGYPHRAMQVIVSLWDGSNWATDGGRTKANWTNAPFQAHFQDFNIDGCPSSPTSPNKDCYSTKYWWNKKKYWELNHHQMKEYEIARKKYMNYDYCTDRSRYPVPPVECHEG